MEPGESVEEDPWGGVDRRVDRDSNSIQCNVCAQFGHGWLICPKGKKEM
jgi:hypothetical protein